MDITNEHLITNQIVEGFQKALEGIFSLVYKKGFWSRPLASASALNLKLDITGTFEPFSGSGIMELLTCSMGEPEDWKIDCQYLGSGPSGNYQPSLTSLSSPLSKPLTVAF
jgi:hypothetical protein